jgi:membrane-bound lytic murein transglycosylase F
MIKIRILVFLVFSTFILNSCKRNTQKYAFYINSSENSDLPTIVANKKLVVLAENSSTSYVELEGVKMGFEYELLKEYTKSIGVKLEVKLISNLDNIDLQLNRLEGDVIACSYTISKDRKKTIDFSLPYLRSAQVLIQRLPSDSTPQYIKDPMQLAHKKIAVWKNSSYYHRIKYLEQEIGEPIDIQPLDGNYSPEKLLAKVANKEIDYTVVDNHIAVANAFTFSHLDHHLRLSIKQQIAFGIRKNNPKLKESLDAWIKAFRKTPHFRFLKKKYFDGKELSHLTYADYLNSGGGKLSSFDKLFKKEAKKYNMEWHIIGAIVQQESNFTPYIKGKGGAFGLMQFMPGTGKRYGVHAASSPASQIKAGMKKIVADFKLWNDIPDYQQRIKFVFATYNAGHSPIEKAQKLAVEKGLNPLVWDNNVEVVLRKRKGRRVASYVKEVYHRYQTLKSLYE